jgi:oligopeptide transport system substrate-binding protein
MISRVKLCFFSTLLFLFSCEEKLEDKIAFGGKKYGGVFSYFTPEKTDVFFPLYSPTVYNQLILSQIFETLFNLDEKGNLVPNLAKSIKISKDSKTITIRLRNDVYFHKDESFSGNLKMTAEDVKYSLDFACSGNKWNSMGPLLRDKIKGGCEYYKKSRTKFTSKGVEGIKIVDDSTIRIYLTKEHVGFQKILAHPCIVVFSKKAVNYYKNDFFKHPIGTGPFWLHPTSKDNIILARNPTYWKKDNFGNQLPFLSEIHIFKSKGIKEEFRAFSKKEADIIFELPVNQLNYTFGSLADAQKGKNLLHKIFVKKGTKINYLSFNCAIYPFNNELVRKAFSLAIDREKICLDAMNGEGNHTINGFIPKSSYYTPNETVILKYDPLAARKLLIEAGFNKQNPFPKLTLYINAQKGGLTDKWSEEIVSQLRANLGVELTIKYCSLAQKYNAILSKKAKIWKSGWVPDYPDADAYLSQFYSNLKRAPNKENNYNSYNSLIFDSLYERTQLETNNLERLRLQRQCDEFIIQKAIVAPLFSEDLFVIVNLNARDFNIGTSGIIEFSRIYIKEVF